MKLLGQKQLKKSYRWAPCENNHHVIETIWLSVEWSMNIKENYKNTEHKKREEKTKKQSKIGLILGVDKKKF